MATILDKELKRQVTVDDVDYTLAVHPDGFRLTGKGKRTPQVELRWRDLLSGEAALAVALNASLVKKKRSPPTTPPAAGAPAPGPASEPATSPATSPAPSPAPSPANSRGRAGKRPAPKKAQH